MSPTSLSRRSMLVAMVSACGQFMGCRQTTHMPMHTWVRDLPGECGLAAVSTIVLPPLGEGPWDLRYDFQRALCAQLRKLSSMKIVEEELSTSGISCETGSMSWDDQLQLLGQTQATQAVVSKVTYLQTTAPIKLGLVVELRDLATRTTLRQVEGLWDAPHCHPPAPKKWTDKSVTAPPWSSDLYKISPRHLLEQAAREVARDLDGISMIGQAETHCAHEAGPGAAP